MVRDKKERTLNELQGVFPVLPTPFASNGALDDDSMRRLVDYVSERAVHGVSILGFLGEAHKLSTSERDQVVKTVVTHKSKGLSVCVGIRALGAAGAVEQAQRACDLGADAVFVAPIPTGSEIAQFEYFRTVASSSSLPMLIHDFPDSFGITISTDLVVRLHHEMENIVGMKLEERPVLPKLSRILAAVPGCRIFGGLGGIYCLEELGRGAIGIMTGFAFPEILVKVYTLFTNGDSKGAAIAFDRYASLLRYEFQPHIGLAFRKYLYKKRGVFETDFIRAPRFEMDEQSRTELDSILNRLEVAI